MQTTIPGAKAKNQLDPAAFSGEEKSRIRAAIRNKYAAVSQSAAGYFKYPVGKKGAEQLGYEREFIRNTPETLLASFCGVGNPFALSPIREGDVVLDIGCGAGFDLAVASRLVGKTGRVYGVDLTPEMVARARTNLADLGVKNGEVLLVSSEQLPFAHDLFDVVISNGVINLSPDKSGLFSEIFRVMKPGGRLQFIDIILEKELPPYLAANVESWSQ